MPSDPGYQVTPPPPRVSVERDKLGSVPVDLQLQQSIWWTGGQWTFVGFEVGALLALVVGLHVLQPEYVSILWHHPTGIRMLIMSVMLLVFNFGGFLGFCLLFNHWMPPGDESKRGRRTIAHLVLALLLLLLFYVPVLFVLSTGPAAIRIQEGLTQGI